MSKFLVSTCETYRIDSEKEVKNFIEENKNDNRFTLSKYVSEYKERKSKGEIIDTFYKVTLTKIFNDIKEPDATVSVNYSVEQGVFPEPLEEDDEN